MSQDLNQKLQHMRIPLSPFYQLRTGLVHPIFPKTVLQYWLLTSKQLNDLARFYNQSTQNRYAYHYPYPTFWDDEWPIEVRRRHFGWFIGLRGDYFLNPPTLD